MKKTFLVLALLTIVLTITQSCKKDTTINTTSNSISVSIDTNQIYQFDLGTFGDEEGATINKNPLHFSISKLDRNISTGKVTYSYKPTLNYSGTDEVELKSSRGSDGASQNNQIILTTIKFTISN